MLKKILLFVLASLFIGGVAHSREVKVSYTDVKGATSSSYFKCISAGRAAEGLRADWREHLEDVQANMPCEYIRFHGLLHEEMGVITIGEKGETIYNFQYVDDLFDYLLSVNIKPFVELSFMPQVLASGTKSIFWWDANVSNPKSYKAWEDLVRALVQHFTKRYGVEEVKSWYFEVWNEPNYPGFFAGTQADYFKLYKASAIAVKSVCEDYRVGGPATAGHAWIGDIIKYCKKENLPLDFLSTHSYGVYGAFDESGVSQLRMVADPDKISKEVKGVRKEMNENGCEDIELHYTEWNTSYSPRDMTHDTYFSAAYVLNTLREVDDAAQSMSYWTFTDILEESGIATIPLHGGFGFINIQGLPKPPYFAYKYLYQLGKEELKNKDENSWVCKDENGGVQMLAYHLVMPEYGENDYSNRLFSVVCPAEDVEPVDFTVTDMPDGLYRMEVYYTGFERNDILTAYRQMGSPAQLYPEQERTLRLSCEDKAYAVEIVEVKGGKFSREYAMRENDICLVKLTPIDTPSL